MIRLFLIIGLFFLLSSAPAVFAQSQDEGPGIGNPQSEGSGTLGSIKLLNPLKDGGTLMDFLQSILGLVIQIGTMVLIVMVIYIGFLFVVAQGNSEKLSQARTMLLWTLIGGVILLGAQGIALGIEATVRALGG
jgi:hypothetical protein